MEFTPFMILLVLMVLTSFLSSTRKHSVLIAGLLLFFYPYPSLGVLALAGIAYYFYRKHQRRNLNVLPRSDT